MGEVIDSYDYVVRFNWYQTTGYEKYIGSKTDMWWTTIFDPVRAKEKYHAVYLHSWDHSSWDKVYTKFKESNHNEIRRTNEFAMYKLQNWMLRLRGMGEIGDWVRSYWTPYSSFSIAAWHFLLEEMLPDSREENYDENILADGITPRFNKISLYGFDWWENDYSFHGDASSVSKDNVRNKEYGLFYALWKFGKIKDLHPESDFHLPPPD